MTREEQERMDKGYALAIIIFTVLSIIAGIIGRDGLSVAFAITALTTTYITING